MSSPGPGDRSLGSSPAASLTAVGASLPRIRPTFGTAYVLMLLMASRRRATLSLRGAVSITQQALASTGPDPGLCSGSGETDSQPGG